MPVVVDTSVALKWVLPEEHRAEALQLRSDCLRLQIPLLAPQLFLHEATNVLTKQVVDELLPRERVSLALFTILDPVELRTFDQSLAERAVRIGVIARRRAFGFDAQFLALAEREGCDFWTADREFADAMHPAFPFVRWIGASVAPPSP